MTNSTAVNISTPTERDLVMTRRFDAPRQRVFDAWTKPELLARWWGAPGWTLPVCEIDLRPGGLWRFVMRGPKGNEMVLHGVYREIAAPARLVYTQRMQGCEGQGDSEARVTAEFAALGDTTLFTNTVTYPTREVRDAVLNSGARGIEQVYLKLDALLAARDERIAQGAPGP